MLQTLLGSESREQVLTYLVRQPEGYATEIARASGLDLYAVQQQLEKFEASGLLLSRSDGRMRVYRFNPEFPLLEELRSLVAKSLTLFSDSKASEDSAPLPKSLSSHFWDYAFENLAWPKDQELIIRRLLTDGSWEAITWLRKQIGDRALRQWLVAHQGRGLSPRQLRFWSLVLALPKRRVDSWVRATRSTPWSNR